jgi:Beta-propeller repeat
VIDPLLYYSTYLGGSAADFGYGIAVDGSQNAYITGLANSVDFPTTAGAYQSTWPGQFPGSQAIFITKLNPTGSGLVYSTYLGGRGDAQGHAIAVDGAGNAYVTGETDSYNSTFPTTVGAAQTTIGGNNDAFVTKLSASGSSLVYSTFLGGESAEDGLGIALDGLGSAYVTGETDSDFFPTTVGAFQSIDPGPARRNGFVAKLNPAGSSFTYSTYLGGSVEDYGLGVAVDSLGNAFVGGYTGSPDFPTTAGALRTVYAGGNFDAFVAKLNPSGSGLLYSTLVGGTDIDQGTAIAIDGQGNAYLTGLTGSVDFPTTAGAFQTTFGGLGDAFVTKLNPAGTATVYSTFLGGSSGDTGYGIAVDASANAYVVGGANSPNFPVLNQLQSFGGGGDAFVTALSPTGGGLIYSTLFGGSAYEEARGVALDAFPNPSAYFAGWTGSSNIPTTSGAFQTMAVGPDSAFVGRIMNITVPAETVGKVNGGGSINVTGGSATFGFVVERHTAGGSVSGDLRYVNHANNSSLHSVSFTSLSINGTSGSFGGTCTLNGSSCTFAVTFTDNGEPGTTDKFTISISAGPAAGGTLLSGNILIHS